MPELPEVEIVARGLASRLAGRRIVAVDLFKLGGYGGLDAREVRARLVGRRVNAVRRAGKRLVVALDGPEDLVFHFKLWGVLLWRITAVEPDRLTALVWRLDGGATLEFRELQLSTLDFVARDATVAVATDPLTMPATSITAALNGRGAVRALLSDQGRFPGLGNLYALEILFRAGVDPRRKGTDLSDRERGAIADLIRKTMREAIRRGGYPPFLDLDGKAGTFPLRVYDRGGQPCAVCGAPIMTARIAGRPGFWCARCQPEPAAKGR